MLLLPAGSASAQFPTNYRDEVLSDSPSAYWRLGETSGAVAADELGANPGAYAGNVLLGQTGALPGDIDPAATFNGSTARVVVPDSNALDATTGVTVEFWMKRTKSSAYQVIVAKPGNGQSKFENYAVWLNTSNRIQSYFGNGTKYIGATSDAIDTNWHHIVATYDNVTARIYVDGVQNATATSPPGVTLTPNTLPLNIGRSNDGQYFFGGSLDEVAVYQSVLSPTRIQAHFAKSIVDVTPPAVSLTAPAAGAVLNNATPTFSGVGGTANGDASTVTVRVYAGTAATGTPVQSRTATLGQGGAYSVAALTLPDGTYTARAEQNDAATNTGFSQPRTFTIDTTAPVASIDAGPSGTVASASASLQFSSNEAGSTFECRIDGAAFAACTSPKAYSSLGQGSHTFSVRATDPAGNTGSATDRTWSVDTVAPVTTIDTHPPDFTSQSSADFTFHADDASSTFECRIDAGAFAACSSPASYTGLGEGVHTVYVRATDTAGNTGTAATFSWTIDLTAPVISLVTPTDGSTTSDTTPPFTGVAGTGAGDASTVTVRVYAGTDTSGTLLQTRTTTAAGDGSYAVDALALSAGTYTARASQADAVGNVGSSTAHTFTVDPSQPDNVPPVVTLTSPSAGALLNTATPAFTGVGGTAPGDDSSVTVRVYAGTGTSGSPVQSRTASVGTGGAYTVNATSLSDGTYTARTEQSDASGNTGFSGTRTFTVDTTAPVASVDSGPSGTVATTSASFTFSAPGSGNSFECRIDGAAFAACTSPKAYSSLGQGSHTFSVRATDPAGNTGSGTDRTWTVDTVAPNITLVTPAPGASVSDPTPAFSGVAGTAAGDAATVTVRLYQGSSASGTPIQVLTATAQSDGSYTVDATTLAEGTYTARAEQNDAAGNTGFSAARTFTRADPSLIGAGDISSCEASDGDDETAAILGQNPDSTIFTLGDNAYVNGQPSEFANCFDPTWGQYKSRIRPTIGDHDWGTVSGGPPAGTGFLNYYANQLAPYGPTATDLTKMYYSYDIGAWHVLVASSNCYQGNQPNCSVPQFEQWAQADLNAHKNQCTVMMWHSPRWSSGNVHAGQTFAQGLWSLAYANGVDVVLNGDEHVYERFVPMDANGNSDPQYGVREFNVGTGGYFHYDLGTLLPTSAAFNSDAYGVLKLTLHDNSYDWRFIAEAGKTFTDTGTGTCHDAPPQAADTPQVRSATSAVANAGVTSMTMNTPAGTQAGDVLLAMTANQGGTSRTLNPPAGWTLIPNTDLSDGTNARIRAWYKVAGASEPASYTFAISGGTNYSSAGGIMAISGASTTSPIDAAGSQLNTAGAKTLTAPSITTSQPHTLLVYGGAVNQPALFTPPQLFIEQWDRSSATTYNVATTAATHGFDPFGATGAATAFLDTGARGPAIQIAVRGAG